MIDRYCHATPRAARRRKADAQPPRTGATGPFGPLGPCGPLGPTGPSRAGLPAAAASRSVSRACQVLLYGTTLLAAGCGGGAARVRPPAIDASAAGQAAIAQYDRDGDGAIAGEELDQVPSLKAAIERIDRTPKDGRITAQEIAARIRAWGKTRVALLPLQCQVMRGRRPVEGATLRLEPEAFLGETVRPALGRTDARGIVAPSVGEAYLPAPSIRGVHLGFYRVVITGPEASGRSEAPRSRSGKPRGLEVAPDAPAVQKGMLVVQW